MFAELLLPHSRQSWLTEESVLQSRVALCRTPAALHLQGPRAALYLLTGRPLLSPAAECMCATLLGAIRGRERHSKRGVKDRERQNH
ncbi:hypothetical protein PBY51_002539 [Eleginops maclovinus]|uniref:Uncharacterized protein n=1 Tax=Eleginops maclovinus TaxID=56733 RepID=A0AAN7XA98_ELEMC|nr:hypothetical protein PBY51_002539 [Eleginops maclovinus]